LRPNAAASTLSEVDEPLIFRSEVEALLFNAADMVDHLATIVKLLKEAEDEEGDEG
jgi:hypothetical protein